MPSGVALGIQKPCLAGEVGCEAEAESLQHTLCGAARSQALEEGMVLALGSVAHGEQRKAKEGSRGWVSPASHVGSRAQQKV